MPIDLLDSKTRSINLTNAAGGAADADSLPTYAITLPDGTTPTPPAVQHGVLGEYYVVYPTVQAGLHQEVFTAAVAGVQVAIRRNFTIEQVAVGFIDTEEALAHLRAAGQISAAPDLEQLRWLCLVACDAVERDLGRLFARRTIVETRQVLGNLVPYKYPVVSLTSVVVDGVTADPATYRLNRGIIESQYGFTTHTAWGAGVVVLTYVAGDSQPPAIARKVALNGVQRMWQSSQQMPHPSMDDVGAEAALFGAVGTLTPLELAAYNSLRVLAIA